MLPGEVKKVISFAVWLTILLSISFGGWVVIFFIVKTIWNTL